jgi:hypothetical protein
MRGIEAVPLLRWLPKNSSEIDQMWASRRTKSCKALVRCRYRLIQPIDFSARFRYGLSIALSLRMN